MNGNKGGQPISENDDPSDDGGWSEFVDSGEAWEFHDEEPAETDTLDWIDESTQLWDYGYLQSKDDGTVRPPWPAGIVERFGCSETGPALWHLLSSDALGRVLETEALLARSTFTPGWSPANLQVVDKRRRARVRAGNGGFVNDYVPFYLTPDTPFAYTAAGKTTKGLRPVPWVFLVVAFRDVADLSWVCCPGNAASSQAKFFDHASALARLPWTDIKSDFRLENLAARQAEILIHRGVPLERVSGAFFSSEPSESITSALCEAIPDVVIETTPELFYQR